MPVVERSSSGRWRTWDAMPPVRGCGPRRRQAWRRGACRRLVATNEPGEPAAISMVPSSTSQGLSLVTVTGWCSSSASGGTILPLSSWAYWWHAPRRPATAHGRDMAEVKAQARILGPTVRHAERVRALQRSHRGRRSSRFGRLCNDSTRIVVRRSLSRGCGHRTPSSATLPYERRELWKG